ncbi:unnamed protein product [Diatraea saccharalis]|uniref:Cytochrome P450 n=1 Tax=Diatraea saccharalis TaxID=40085 RepID=A0A9N9R8N3_9NEOP|nr:unnamed protein product [Diatraea saccharalis]
MFVLLFLVLLLIILLVSWLSFYLDKKHTNVRGPLPYPLIGNANSLFAIESTEFMNVLSRLEEKYDKTALIYLFSQRYILTSDPKFIEGIVSSAKLTDKGKSYYFMEPWLGEGLLTSSGPRWKAHRKFLTPAFHFNILHQFLPIFCKNATVLIKKLHNIAIKNCSTNLFPIIALAALDNVTESIMAVSFNAQGDSGSEFVKAVDAISTVISKRMWNPFLDLLFPLTSYKTKQDKALKILHGQTIKIIKARQEELKKMNISELVLHTKHGTKNKHTFLDLLLLAEVDGKKISDQWIREEVDTFLFEGHDTITSAITFCLYCLAQNQDIQEKVFQEQKNIFGHEFDRSPSSNDLQQMKYLEFVIKESLRLFPSVPIIQRKILEDTVINGMRIPKNTSIVLDLFNMQRDPRVYEDPLEFRPERFENTGRNPFTWLPFSAGPRNCIGQKFAMMEMKVTISEIIRNFIILPTGQVPILAAELILRTVNGVNLKIVPRL